MTRKSVASPSLRFLRSLHNMNRETCTAICQTFDRTELRSAIPDDKRAAAFARAIRNLGRDAFDALEAAVMNERAVHRTWPAP